MRTLSSHVAYYERWAKDWEFQALLKARHVAGDAELGAEYEAAIAPFVWSSSARDGFVESVHRMRERVTEHIASDEAARQLKLGPGGLRDIEFTVQLLQLVHGATDDGIRHRGTLPALSALSEGGYIGRSDATEFAEHYRFLRLLEHRLQLLAACRRTHLMPDEPKISECLPGPGRRPSASQARLASDSADVERDVRNEPTPVRMFYSPLLSAVAALPDDQIRRSPAIRRSRDWAHRLPGSAQCAAAHRSADERGQPQVDSSEMLLPVMLQWFGEGSTPTTAWSHSVASASGSATALVPRMLRDSKVAARG